MVKSGIVLIVLAVTAPAVAFVAALFGFGAIAGLAFTVAKVLSPLLLMLGIVLLVVGVNRGRARSVG